jgi:digeranylgeranylglycerophospholipid reductase
MAARYDAVVVGAGPAGLMAARKIAKRGFTVLMLEKDRDFGVRTCAEAVSETAFKTAEIPVTQSLISNTVEGALVFPPNESKGVRIAGEHYRGYILNKPLFLSALAKEAVAAGADLQMRSEVKSIALDGGNATKITYEHKGELKDAEFKVLVGADGVGSIVAKSCGFDLSGYALIPTMQYVMVNCNVPEGHMIRIYMGREVAPLGYAWVFSKNEFMANVGIGVRGRPAKPYLDKFIASHPEFFGKAKVVKEGGGGVPCGGQIREVVRSNVVLCGDSAGQVIPITGGGIRTSMAAGSVSGDFVAKALEAGDMSAMSGYPSSYSDYWGSRISKSLKVLRAIEEMSDDDLNALGSVLSGEDVVELANGLDFKRVVSKLMMHPVLAMKLASKLL